jgi:DNA-binding PucR family transcriptional regulator
VVVDISAGDGPAILGALEDLGLVAEHDGFVVCITATVDPDPLLVVLRRRLDRYACTTTLDGPVDGAAAIAESHHEARRAVGLLGALGRSGSVATVDELGPFRYLFGRAGADDAARFVDRTVGPVLAHDAGRGSDLTRTLEIYLQNAQQHATSAALLGIHANTLYQRLARIGELLGDDWRTRALELHLALRLHQLGAELARRGSGATGS